VMIHPRLTSAHIRSRSTKPSWTSLTAMMVSIAEPTELAIW
jgi:hypothetical protein